mgnify:FL=1
METLIVYGTSLDDESVAELSPCLRLRRLHLENTLVTDASLPVLQSLGLTELTLRNTKLSPAAIAAFKKARPECKID